MKRIFGVLLLLFGATIAFGQASPQTTGVGAPTGPCTSTTTYLDTAAHNNYNCNNGTWVLVGSGSQYQSLPVLTSYNNVLLVANGIPSIVAKADATAQAANVPVTTLYAVPASGAGMYRIGCYVVLTQAATTSSTLPACNIQWVDNDTSASLNAQPGTTVTSNTVGTNNVTAGGGSQNTAIVNAKASSNITFNTAGYASTGATTMQYAVHIKLEYLGN